SGGVTMTVGELSALDAATPAHAHPTLPRLSRGLNLPRTSAPRASQPGAAGASDPLAPQTLGTSFTGATLADTNAFPPDSMGDVGPGQYIVAVNGRIRSFNKSTGVADGALNADTD